MIDVNIIIMITIIIIHYTGDKLLPTYLSIKSTGSINYSLCIHVLIYGMLMLSISPTYAVINAVLHYYTDYYVHNSKYQKVYRWLDGAIHLSTLIITYVILNTYGLLWLEYGLLSSILF